VGNEVDDARHPVWNGLRYAKLIAAEGDDGQAEKWQNGIKLIKV
jgi:hypothetical protein